MAQTHIIGCLLGTALGDAIGLPYEGLSRQRAARLLGAPDRHRFLFGRGMISDDTEHTCLVAQSMVSSQGEADQFRDSLAARLRVWLLCLPAGVGLATARAIVKLWFGASPQHSGVFSAGNGPAMRAAIIGASIDDDRQMRDLVKASARLTHIDPKAEYAALAIALAAQMARQQTIVNARDYAEQLRVRLDATDAEELLELIDRVVISIEQGQSPLAFTESLGLSRGVSGYAYHSVPVALHAWLANQTDFRAAISRVVACGGDADSTAAMVGGIIGAAMGDAGLPDDWLRGLADWPYSVSFMRNLGSQLHSSITNGEPQPPDRVPFPAVLLRNFLFLVVVLYHGFRRLLPPY